MDRHDDVFNKDALNDSTYEEGRNEDKAIHVNKKISTNHSHVGNTDDGCREPFLSDNELIDGIVVLSQNGDGKGPSFSDEEFEFTFHYTIYS